MTTKMNHEQTEPSGPMTRKGVTPSRLLGRRIAPYARVAAFVATLIAVGTGYAIHRAQAQVGEQLVSMGEMLMQYDDAAFQDQTRVLSLNGQPLRFSSGDTERPLSDVLDYFEAVCASRDGGVLAHVEDLRADHPSIESPVYRYDRDREGVVACLDMGNQALSMDVIRERTARFSETQDLNDLGDIRYVYASRQDESSRTHFVAFWTDGTFRMDQVLPADGDAGGTDIPNVARPPGSRRTLSASEVGSTDMAVQYSGSTMTTWELEHFYQEELPRSGWELVAVPDGAQDASGDRMVLAHSETGGDLYVSLMATDEGSQATIVLGR